MNEIEKTYQEWRDSIKSPNDSIFYYHEDLDRILLGLAIFVLASRPIVGKLGKAEMLRILHLQVPDLITYWIDGNYKGFKSLFPLVMFVCQGYASAAFTAEDVYPSNRKAIRTMAYLHCNSCGLAGDMNRAFADELLDDLSSDGKNLHSDKIEDYGKKLLFLTQRFGLDIPFSKLRHLNDF